MRRKVADVRICRKLKVTASESGVGLTDACRKGCEIDDNRRKQYLRTCEAGTGSRDDHDAMRKSGRSLFNLFRNGIKIKRQLACDGPSAPVAARWKRIIVRVATANGRSLAATAPTVALPCGGG